ncbi:MAG: Fe-S cluster assembly protein SufD [Planctomycetes bacterium]|nr:Fe-S cluster assembly protein SufD [Planctomycetota bacterium]
MDKTTFTKLFADFDRDASPRYRALRQAARERFASLPLPTTRAEDWRFTSIAPLLEMPFDLPTELRKSVRIADEVLGGGHEKLPLAVSGSMRLTFVNGRLARSLSVAAKPDIYAHTLDLLKVDVPELGQIAAEKENVFTALNTSLLSDGAVIVVPDGKVVEYPIEIVYLSRPGDKSCVGSPRSLVRIGKNAQALVIERFLGERTYFTNAVTEIAVGAGAVLNHVKIQDESATAYHIANTQIVMAARSNFTTHYLSLGGALVRNEVRVRFDGEHAEATVNGLYLASGKQHIDNFTVIDHAQPNCASHELYKGILDDKAHGVFNGKILVRKDAQKTDAKQTNKVLLLSDDATINTKPQLEIFADDVKCTHGATIGQLDAAQLFYLQSRGIPLDAARRLLTFAFANDIVNRVRIEAIREELEARIVR